MSHEEPELSLFQPQIRRVWHRQSHEWFYSINDVIAVLTDSKNPQSYWSVLKGRLKKEGADNTLAQIASFRLKAADGRFRLTDMANRQTLLRLLQSIPSEKVEPFKRWLAQVGEDRLEEIEHPEVALERVREKFRQQGRDEAWIEARIRSDLIRNDLTDEWRARGAQEAYSLRRLPTSSVKERLASRLLPINTTNSFQ